MEGRGRAVQEAGAPDKARPLSRLHCDRDLHSGKCGSESGAVHTQASLGLSCSWPHFLAWDLPGRASLSLAHPSFGPDLPKPKTSAALGSCGLPKTNSLTVLMSPTSYTYVQHQEPHGIKLWGADAK